jgi:excisionase family DNA binding protein
MAEYMSFEEVLKELQVDEEELKKLVSQGELRGFRDGTSMKFKKEDVLNLKKGRETEPTIILTDSDQEMGIAESSDELILDESTSDTVLNIGDIMSPEKQEEEIVFSDSTEEFSISPHDSDPEAAIPTVEVPSVGEDLGISGETDSDAALVAAKSAPEMNLGATTEAPSIKMSDSSEELADAKPKGKPAPMSGRSPATKSTGKVKAIGSTKERPVAKEPEPELDLADDGMVAPRKTQSGRISRSARLRAIQMKQRPSDMIWSTIALVAAVFLVLPGPIVINRLMGVSPQWVVNFADKFRWIGELF